MKKIITIITAFLLLLTFVSVVSGESEKDELDIIDHETNSPPNAPVLSQEKSGWIEEMYKCTFSSIDPDGDNVYFHINWGKKETNSLTSDPDEPQKAWFGPYKSGEEVTFKHKWKEPGKYTVTIKAKDTYDRESPETSFTVTNPKVKISHNTVIYQVLLRLANFFPILKMILNF
jgi:hypothetical protein